MSNHISPILRCFRSAKDAVITKMCIVAKDACLNCGSAEDVLQCISPSKCVNCSGDYPQMPETIANGKRTKTQIIKACDIVSYFEAKKNVHLQISPTISLPGYEIDQRTTYLDQ
ncbi:hypothetical protein CEXT_267481 [Caerostris extrusa]|uniref:Uncharacterized protein n=1 Tax=Caerostris extrusa TaxID=172846 RepID=A0AAV4VYX5_CAEEX|nr:hypothetical protein CEXT_267481 [Caerostris extrusa]